MTWMKAASLDELRNGPIVFKDHSKQIAVFRVNGSVYAIDNRCPHEGYPLAAGKLSEGCVLTCNWHNWKFRLDTGECLIGGDDVRSYPTKIDAGHAWVNIADPPPEENRRRILAGLAAAFEDRDYGRISREIARLHYFGLDPADAVREALNWAHDRLEFGTTHAVAAAADWLNLAGKYKDDFESRLICLSEAVDHLSDDVLRQPQYAYAEPGEEPFERKNFLGAVENEDTSRAEAMTARALAEGIHWRDLEQTFAAAAFAHYNDFGHSVIYVLKTGELIEGLGPSVERILLLPLARHLCYTTREDLLPEFKDYNPTLIALRDNKTSGRSANSPEVPFPSTTGSALQWVRTSLVNHRPEQVYDSLLEALALNLLSYDIRYGAAYDGPVTQNVSWLDFTHGLTMSNAARRLCSRYPEFWKEALAQMACFLGRNHDFIDRGIDRNAWAVEDSREFFQQVDQKLFDHGYAEAIYAVHLLKTSLAVADELETASESCRGALLAALNRFLQSPLKTKHVRRTSRQSISLVARDFM